MFPLFVILVGCRSDAECSDDKACRSGECTNPCLVQDPCGSNAECYATNHRAMCRCRPGFRGTNPYLACYIIECLADPDCPTTKACINEKCVSPCLVQNPCAPSQADCIDQDHKALCQCRVGYQGNPYVSCDPPRRRAECVTDGDCPSQLACFSESCQNPCIVISPCQAPAQCRVIDTVPVRTVVCQCPEGYVALSNGACRLKPAIPLTGCTADHECSDQEACYNGKSPSKKEVESIGKPLKYSITHMFSNLQVYVEIPVTVDPIPIALSSPINQVSMGEFRELDYSSEQFKVLSWYEFLCLTSFSLFL